MGFSTFTQSCHRLSLGWFGCVSKGWRRAKRPPQAASELGRAPRGWPGDAAGCAAALFPLALLSLPRTRGLDEHVGERGGDWGRRAHTAVAACGVAGQAGADGEAAGRGVKGQREAAGAGPSRGHGAAAGRGCGLQQRAAWGCVVGQVEAREGGVGTRMRFVLYLMSFARSCRHAQFNPLSAWLLVSGPSLAVVAPLRASRSRQQEERGGGRQQPQRGVRPPHHLALCAIPSII